jgi:hypothetical protein
MSPICVQHLAAAAATAYRPTSYTTSGTGSLYSAANSYDVDTSTFSSQLAESAEFQAPRAYTVTYSGWSAGTRTGKLVIRRETTAGTDNQEYANSAVFLDYSTDAGGSWATLETTTNATGWRALADIEVALSAVTMANLRVRVRTNASGGYDEFDTYCGSSAEASIYDIRFEE